MVPQEPPRKYQELPTLPNGRRMARRTAPGDNERGHTVNVSCSDRYIEIDAAEFLLWSKVLSLEEVGKLFTEMSQDAQQKAWTKEYDLPFIRRHVRGISLRPTIPAPLKREILKHGRCAFCGSDQKLTIDHIKPFSKGGSSDRNNLQCLCFSCNLKKSDHWEGE
jgi:hypothetical protein